ncbi:MAG: NAD-dependent epimerase/dehydratase family protein [Ignavibacteria bacterium]|jgi:UDP-glucose 4-epimerase|nr:NAD-dependent epimerase/dehydratase family protein [Ignavibacteria bacterium]
MPRYFIAGGAGFIGSHLVRKILREEPGSSVVIFDNFSSGQMWHIEDIVKDTRLTVVRGDIKEFDFLVKSMNGCDCVYHFASNPDISKAVTQPDIDFWEGTYLTNNIIESVRINGIRKIIYASGSGVYGDAGYTETAEDYSPMIPVSTYGASKLSGEALLSSYSFMFDINAAAFRFANVVGPNQTHGVGYDFINKLIENPEILRILGNGKQSKSYIYVNDVLSAIRLVEKNFLKGYSYFNVSTEDYITVKEIAEIVIELMNLGEVVCKFGNSDRGWKGDVPVVRLNSEKIRNLGWKNKLTSREAIMHSVSAMLKKIDYKK